jgi:putative alpha-1,2-mannosidase
VELTTTERTGLYRFTFPKTDGGTVLCDLGPGEASVEIVGDHTIRGQGAYNERRNSDGRLFVAEFSQPFKSFGGFRQNLPTLTGGQLRRSPIVQPGARAQSGSYAGCYLNFAAGAGEPVLLKIASGATFDQARQRLKAECPGWNFAAVKNRAADLWNKALSRIEVKGGSEKERTLFYSTLYHVYSSPRLVARRGEPFGRKNGQTRVLDYDRYSRVPFWDRRPPALTWPSMCMHTSSSAIWTDANNGTSSELAT